MTSEIDVSSGRRLRLIRRHRTTTAALQFNIASNHQAVAGAGIAEITFEQNDRGELIRSASWPSPPLAPSNFFIDAREFAYY
jgi:hypothetical protein